MSDKCNLVKDILPLYIEDMVSADTRELVSKHLEHCAECRAELKQMQKPAEFIPDTDIAPLKRIKKELLIKRLQTIFITAMSACAIAAVIFAVLTSPGFFPYSDSLMNVTGSPDGNITIAFAPEVTGYSCTREFNSETETEIYRINAWNTAWDLYMSDRGKQNVVISPGLETKLQIFYVQNDGSEDVLIYGPNRNADEGVATLPRLVLMPYFLSALLAFSVLVIARFLLRNKPAVIVWIDRAVLFPVSYMAAHLCTKGTRFTTYSLQHDFCFILLVAILFYFVLLTGKALYKVKRKNPGSRRLS